jgi:hypothetical protein
MVGFHTPSPERLDYISLKHDGCFYFANIQVVVINPNIKLKNIVTNPNIKVEIIVTNPNMNGIIALFLQKTSFCYPYFAKQRFFFYLCGSQKYIWLWKGSTAPTNIWWNMFTHMFGGS